MKATIKHIIAVAVLAIAGTAGMLGADYAALEAKAARFFTYGEWANAAATYEVMLDERPDSAMTYCRAIVVAGMRDMPDYQMSLVERAESRLIPLQTLFEGVRSVSFSLGNASLYENLLLLVRQREPWLGRSIDRQLLDYYMSRRDGPAIVRMAGVMLSTAPDNAHYLNCLAFGLMQEGRVEQGLDTYRRNLEHNPDNYTALLAVGNHLIQIGRTEEARPYLEKANTIYPSPYLHQLLSTIP